jgi:hypothetical protein
MRQKLQQKQTPSLQLRRAMIAGGLLLMVLTPVVVLYLVNQPTSSEGQPPGGSSPPGHALDFDGSDDYVEVNNVSDDVNNSSLTIEAWFKSRETPSAGVGSIFAFNTSNGRNTILVYDNMVFDSRNNQNEHYNASTRDGNWHHLAAVVKKGADSLIIYIDGVKDIS